MDGRSRFALGRSLSAKFVYEWYIVRSVLVTLAPKDDWENHMAAKKKAKVEIYQTAAALKKHENSEGKKIVAMEKKQGEKDVVKAKKANGKKTAKSI